MDTVGVLLGLALGFLVDRAYEFLFPRLKIGKLRYVLPIGELSGGIVHVRPSVEVLSSGKGLKSKRAYTHASELRALNLVASVCHKLPIELKFSYDDINESDGSGWILLGLSRGKSKIASSILDRINSTSVIKIVKPEDDHQYFIDNEGNEYRCKHVFDQEYSSRIQVDYGIIYRCMLDDGTLVLLCGGIHMFATQASVEICLSRTFLDKIKIEDCQEFIQLVEVRVRDDGINIESESKRWIDMPFYRLG